MTSVIQGLTAKEYYRNEPMKMIATYTISPITAKETPIARSAIKGHLSIIVFIVIYAACDST
jgi:hypothetical protein